MDGRILGGSLMVLAAAMAIVIFMLSSALIASIDMGPTCSSVSTCSHVQALNTAYIGYGLAGAVFVCGLFLFFGRGVTRKKIAIAPADLNPDEKRVFDLLRHAGGMMFQSEIVEKTGFPKARVTRVLDRLESRGSLERRRRGMTNAVFLK